MFRVLAFTVKPRESADCRYRILQYQSIAEEDSIRIDHRSLIGSRYFGWQIKNKRLMLRLLLYPYLWVVRLLQVLFLAPRYDAVWLLREMSPLGPPLLEQLLIARCKRVILDVDDALHIADKEGSQPLALLLRDLTKFGRLAASYSAVVCGNRYLADFYRQHSANVEIVPTVVDADRYSSVVRIASDITRIGWIGTPLNKHHLESLYPALASLVQKRRFELVIVGLNEALEWNLPYVRYMQWSLEEELTFFAHFDIGIMPLEDTEFTRGKCAFKLIQCMAAGLPVTASPVGANCEVVIPGINGYFASTQEEWQSALTLLLDDADLRRRLGGNGVNLVRQSYSVRGVWPSYYKLLTGTRRKVATCVA